MPLPKKEPIESALPLFARRLQEFNWCFSRLLNLVGNNVQIPAIYLRNFVKGTVKEIKVFSFSLGTTIKKSKVAIACSLSRFTNIFLFFFLLPRIFQEARKVRYGYFLLSTVVGSYRVCLPVRKKKKEREKREKTKLCLDPAAKKGWDLGAHHSHRFTTKEGEKQLRRLKFRQKRDQPSVEKRRKRLFPRISSSSQFRRRRDPMSSICGFCFWFFFRRNRRQSHSAGNPGRRLLPLILFLSNARSAEPLRIIKRINQVTGAISPSAN